MLQIEHKLCDAFVMIKAVYVQVAERVQEQKLDMTELEFGLLLQACARGGASWKQVQALLKRMARELTRLQPETLAAAEQYFRYACTLCFDRFAILLHTHMYIQGPRSCSVCSRTPGPAAASQVSCAACLLPVPSA